MRAINVVCVGVVLLFAVVCTNGSVLRQDFGYYYFAEDSCAGRCNQSGTVPGAPCQCNSACIRFNDCCPDYPVLCLGIKDSCQGRCQQSGTIPGTCQCNKACKDYNDCCPDYEDLCMAGSVTDEELAVISNQLLSLDTENNATAYVKVDIQGQTEFGSSQDMAPNPLLTVQQAAFSRKTIQKMVALHDNYEADVSVKETYTQEELVEINDFIDALFETSVMQAAQAFLESKKLPSGRDNFFEMWFGLYKRGADNSSSGFEHAFLGEIKKGQEVSGFHNWEFFNREEDGNRLNYMGYMDFVDFGPHGSIVEHTFSWAGERKPISSMFIGTSPELELALYTVCWHSRPNAKCPVSLAGNLIKIQTYTIGSRSQYVATSYPDLSD